MPRCSFLRRRCKQCGMEFDRTNWHENPCPVCGKDRQCGNKAVAGYRRCYFRGHGGPNPKYNFWGQGAALVSGYNSNFPLVRLASKYKEMTTDGRLLSNRHSIEIVRYRIGELLERINLNEAPDRLMKLMKLWKKFSQARFHGDDLDVIKYQKALDAEFEAAYHDYAAWKQMFDAVDLEKNLVESEVRIAKDLRAIMTAEDGYQMLAKVFAIILEIEDDPYKLKRYQYEITKLVGDNKVAEEEIEKEMAVNAESVDDFTG